MSDASFAVLMFCGFTAFILFSIGYLVGAWHTLRELRRNDDEW
jgi:hypothetical protein